MCLAATRVYSGYKSFALSANDTITETAQWQLFFTMYATLAIRDNYNGGEGQGVLRRTHDHAPVCRSRHEAGVIMGLLKNLNWKVTAVSGARTAKVEAPEIGRQPGGRQRVARYGGL